MAQNNLRILYSNVADDAVITATSTASGFLTTNMQSDIKGLVWRSTSLVSNTITLTWNSDQAIRCIVLPYTNLTTTATVRFVCKNSSGTVIYDSGTSTAVSYNLTGSRTGGYAYGEGSLVRHYLSSTLTTVRSIEITVVDSSNIQSYIEISRIICGTYWSPTYNTEFGLSVEYKDQSQHSRAQAGNIITDIGPSYKILNFNLGYMNDSDRDTLVSLLRQNGLRKALWVSLFPSDSDPEKEYIYSVYGKLSQSSTITHPMYSQYTSSITIEEV